MGKKYIIELLDECNSEFKGIMVFGLTQEKQISVELIPEESLRPYTEPDLDAIKQEEYEKGYKTAKVQCNIQAEKDLREVGERHYQKGLNDAWEAARKIIHMPEADLLNLFTECYAAVCTSVQVFLKYDASECIEKIRAYEQGKEEIKVGDEVEAVSGKAVIIEVLGNGKDVRYMYPDASTGFNDSCNVTRTGRHFPEIAEVLRKINETECSV